jgi:uncharacterized protein YhbP (UPF0306 family)
MTADVVASQPELEGRVLAYLENHNILNLATQGPGGLWAAAVFYVHEGLHIYFTSVPGTRHGVNMSATGRAAGTINDDVASWQTMKGVQLDGLVRRVENEDELRHVVAAYLARFPFAAGLWDGETDPDKIVRALGSHAFFRLTPRHLLFWDNEHGGRHELQVD